MLLVVVAFALGIAWGYRILVPIGEIVTDRQLQARFYLSDYFALSFILAMQFGWHSLAGSPYERRNPGLIFVTGVLCIVWCFVWGRCAAVLSTAGVKSAAKRFMFLAFVLPITLIGSAVVVPASVVFAFSGISDAAPGMIAFWIASLAAVLFSAILGPGVIRWVFRISPSDEFEMNAND